MVHAAARELRLPPHQVAVIGDIGSDVEAALAAGAQAVLVPTAETKPDEVKRAWVTAESLDEAVELLLARR